MHFHGWLKKRSPKIRIIYEKYRPAPGNVPEYFLKHFHGIVRSFFSCLFFLSFGPGRQMYKRSKCSRGFIDKRQKIMKKEAMYAEKAGADNVRCLLCPHRCLIKPGKRGICRVRKNVNGTLVTETYGKLSAVHIDPVEKKPLYHFYPGRTILSVGSIGCNMHCDFCQNWDISQSSPDNFHHLKEHFPEELAEVAAESKDNIGIAYTYNEPVVFYEMMIDTARLVHKRGKMNVAVTNAFIEPDPLQELIPLMDAFNVDLKAFDKEFYRKYAGARLE
ncbi:MAG TPA: AmmeMemoRadiSam system radical SAM enzyme, partial [Bacteroidetes bacterium]|nr:AmmeMemoRadiSam system radical SAM enzyme [Bacteroidota bacterium]